MILHELGQEEKNHLKQLGLHLVDSEEIFADTVREQVKQNVKER